jgi:hypothetical protein
MCEDAAVVDAVGRQRHDQLIAGALMVAFAMVMLDELGNSSTQRRFTDENHPVEAGFLDCSNETLRVRVEIRRTRREANDLDATAV